MFAPTDFALFKKYLCDCDYPQISSLNDEFIKNLLWKDRHYLLKWVVCQLDASYEEITENPEKVANVLCEWGFCGENDKLNFILKPEAIPCSTQVRIFNRLFKAVTLLHNNKATPETNDLSNKVHDEEVNLETFENFLSRDLNVFPAFGPVHKATLPDDYKVVDHAKYMENLELKVNELKQCREILLKNCPEKLDSEKSTLERDILDFESVVKKFSRTLSEKLKSHGLPDEAVNVGVLCHSFEKLNLKLLRLSKLKEATDIITTYSEENEDHIFDIGKELYEDMKKIQELYETLLDSVN